MDRIDLGWVGLGIVSALGAAGVTIFGRIGLDKVDSTLATALRSVIMAALLIALALYSGQLRTVWEGTSNIDTRAVVFIVLAGFSGALSWLAYFAALKLGQASQVGALDRLSIAFIFILGVLVLGEQHTWRGWLGLLLLVGGIYMVAADKVK